jgi:carbonic anhydrase
VEESSLELIYRYDPYRAVSVKRPADAEAAIRQLVTGNRRLIEQIRHMQQALMGDSSAPSQTVVPVDLVALGLPFFPGTPNDQAPFALVLGCSDARVPIESIFDQSFNDLFVVRIAGNVLGTECLGSFDFAVRHLGASLKATVVLGHTSCGAVSAAVDAYLSPNDYADIAFTHPLRSLVDRIMISVRGAANAFDRRYGHSIHKHPHYRAALIEASAYLNAAITAYDLQRESRGFCDHAMAVYYGVCDIGTMLVRGCPIHGEPDEPELRLAPRNADELIALSNQLVEIMADSPRLR